jgi:hypothetical protein
MAQLGGFQPAIGAGEQLRSQRAFDLLQGLAGPGLGQGHLLGRLEQRAVVGQGNQQPQLAQVQARGDGGQKAGYCAWSRSRKASV